MRSLFDAHSTLVLARSAHSEEVFMYAKNGSTGFRFPRAALAVLALLALGLSACALNNKEKGAIIGGVGGGVAGGVIGNQTGSTTRGAIIGAVVGGAAGAVIGHQMDQQAKELQQNIPGATVTRVGEGIAVTFASGLLYDFDSDVVRSEAAQNLRNLASSLNKYPSTDLLIVGHTDAVGSSEYNQGLSQRRSTAAANYLTGQGVDATRLQAVGRGETEPLATNDTEGGRQLNRRVEIAIYANASARKGN
jgi:outer membrane protein OmpA-like peptidoglycan-associated protein